METLSPLIIPATLPVSSFPINGEFFDLDCISFSANVHFVSGSNSVSDALFAVFIVTGSSPNSLRGLTDKSSTHLSGVISGSVLVKIA